MALLLVRAVPDLLGDDEPARTAPTYTPGLPNLPFRVDGQGEAATPTPTPSADSASGESVTRQFRWSYGGYDWNWDLQLPTALHDHYRDRDFVYDGPNHAYDVYVLSTADDPYIQAIADELTRTSNQKGWGDADRVSLALAFVQSLEYTPDDVTTGFDEYPKYPVETLWDHGGDCEDTSILFASIVKQMGIGVVMFGILNHPDPHMAVGVAADNSRGAYGGLEHGGRFYAFAETTGSGFRLGEVPDTYERVSPRVFGLQDRPFMHIEEWEVSNDGRAAVRWNAANYGSRDAAGYEMVAQMTSEAGVTDSLRCPLPRMEPEHAYVCEGHLDWPTTGTAVVRFYVVKDGTAVASVASDE